jgi:hypothetical protein
VTLPLDEALENVRAEDSAGIRTWLRRNQPASGGWHWWERVAILGLHRVYESLAEVDRREWALLVATTTEEAVDQGVVTPYDGAIRTANLAAYLVGCGTELFDSDQIVSRCLSLVEIPFEDAVQQVGDWRLLPIARIRVLRHAKNLLGPCRLLVDRVTDPSILGELRRWLELREQLP